MLLLLLLLLKRRRRSMKFRFHKMCRSANCSQTVNRANVVRNLIDSSLESGGESAGEKRGGAAGIHRHPTHGSVPAPAVSKNDAAGRMRCFVNEIQQKLQFAWDHALGKELLLLKDSPDFEVDHDDRKLPRRRREEFFGEFSAGSVRGIGKRK